jgi:hypothetical protein
LGIDATKDRIMSTLPNPLPTPLPKSDPDDAARAERARLEEGRARARETPLADAMRQLEALASRARLLLVARRAIGVLASALGAAAVLVVLDWIFRFPAPLRAIFLLAGLATTATAFVRLVVPAWRFRPTPTDLALRIERSSPSLRGRLASGIEFAMSDEGRSSPLAARSMRDLVDRLAGESILSWLAPRRSLAELSTALGTVAVVGLVAALVPVYAAIGAERLLLPFGGAAWPARTAVESLLGERTHHAKGRPLVLAARLVEGDADSERLGAEVRFEREDGSTQVETLVLTRQPDGRYERVLEGDPSTVRIDVRFVSADNATEPQTIEFVPPPAVASSRLLLAPPAYAVALLEERIVDLGPGTDERSTLREPALEGSTAEMEVVLARPLSRGGRPLDDREAAGMVRVLEPESGLEPVVQVDPDRPERWTIRWTVAAPTSFRLALVDQHGIEATDEIVYRVESMEDRPPTAAVLVPATDESVLPTAVVPIEIEARDDVGLSLFGLLIARREDGANTDVPFGDSMTEAEGLLVRRDAPLDLGTLSVKPGDVLTLTAAAEDGFELDGVRHPRTSSAPRTLRIIGETELGKQIRNQLSAIRRSAIRLDEQQSELMAATQNGRFDPTLERGQAQVSERLRVAGESLQELARRVDRNRLVDEELAATLDQADDLLDMAGKASARASEALERRREAGSAHSAAGQPAGQPAGQDAAATEAERAERQAQAAKDVEGAQEDVRAEIEDLVKLLDRDEDAWAMGRAIDRLKEEVDDLAKRTEETGRSTVGQSMEELNADDRAALEAIEREQKDAAKAAEELLDELRTRADALERADRSRAQAMRQAAQAGEERRLQRNLEQAGEEAGRNRIEQARSAQQAAQAALADMQRGLDDVRKAKVEELRRALESLEQSIERLVKVNEDELIALARLAGPDDAENIADRARAMAKLAQNTQAVAAEARAAGSEANSIARLLDRASDSHGAAVAAFRATPVRLADAQAAEERGLGLLRDALEQTRQTRQEVEEREAERRKAEIVAEYRRLQDRQAAALAGTIAVRPKDPAQKLDRRGLIEARRWSITQGEIGRDLGAMLEQHEDLKASIAFRQAHELIADWASDASARLAQGDLTERTTAGQQNILETISQLITSLEDAAQEEQQFAEENQPEAGGEQSGGEGGGAQQQGAILPVAELRLLRGLQVQLLERTRRLDGVRAAGEPDAARTAEIDAELRSLAAMQERVLNAAVEVVKKLEQPALPAGDGPADGPSGPETPSESNAPKESGPPTGPEARGGSTQTPEASRTSRSNAAAEFSVFWADLGKAFHARSVASSEQKAPLDDRVVMERGFEPGEECT